MATEADVRRVCLGLPEVVEVPCGRAHMPGFRVKGKLFARLRADPDALVVWRPDVREKEALMSSEPDKFFETDHYAGYATVLVRLEAVDLDELAEILTESWVLRAPARLVKTFEAAGSEGG